MGRVAWPCGGDGHAAWSVRDEIEDYALSAALGRQSQGCRPLVAETSAPLATGLPGLDGLHEVGLSDCVLAGL